MTERAGKLYFGGSDNKVYFLEKIGTAGGMFVNSIKSQNGQRITLGSSLFVPCDRTKANCFAAFSSQYCAPESAFSRYLMASFCPLFDKHPPYSCSRQIKRSISRLISRSLSCLLTFISDTRSPRCGRTRTRCSRAKR